jgi:hypothetical protein
VPAQKKIPQTDAIFDQLNVVKDEAAQDEHTLRVSMDAKATVKVGPFSRGGRSRVPVRACDHDFTPESTITPFGLLLPERDELFLYFTKSKVTADFIVDVLQAWWESQREGFRQITTLVVELDNGPENHSRRTQFLKRIVDFAYKTGLRIRLAYYPPYHSKYNPVERSFGCLENHWNGGLLDSVQAVLGFAQSMTWKGRHPIVTLITKTYETGVSLTQSAMKRVESFVKRLEGLEKFFVDIAPPDNLCWNT